MVVVTHLAYLNEHPLTRGSSKPLDSTTTATPPHVVTVSPTCLSNQSPHFIIPPLFAWHPVASAHPSSTHVIVSPRDFVHTSMWDTNSLVLLFIVTVVVVSFFLNADTFQALFPTLAAKQLSLLFDNGVLLTKMVLWTMFFHFCVRCVVEIAAANDRCMSDKKLADGRCALNSDNLVYDVTMAFIVGITTAWVHGWIQHPNPNMRRPDQRRATEPMRAEPKRAESKRA